MVGIHFMSAKILTLLSTVVTVAFISFSGTAVASGAVSAEIDRTKIYLDETAKLVIIAEGQSLMGHSPQLAVLEQDFEIAGQSTQTNMHVENGRTEVNQQWVIEIRPRRVGTLRIPPIGVGGLLTNSLEIEVSQYQPNIPSTDADVFFDVEIIPKDPYVQSQVTFVIRLFYSIDILRGTITEPQVAFGEMEKLGSDRRYTAQHSGRNYSVAEIRYISFPEKSGQFEIPPIDFNGIVSNINSTNLQRINSKIRISSPPQMISIRPKPVSFTGSVWLPAKDIQITDSWQESLPNFESGKPEQRQITVEAVGLRSTQLPSLAYESNDSTRIYNSNPELKDRILNGLFVSQRSEEFAIIPRGSGEIEVPAFKLVWWDIDEDREKVAMLPAISNSQASALVESDQFEDSDPSAALMNSLEKFSEQGTVSVWKIATAILLLVWLTTLVIWYLHNRRSVRQTEADDQSQMQRASSVRQVLRELKSACTHSDVTAVAQLLMKWAVLKWPQNPPRNLLELGLRLNNEALYDELKSIDRCIYSAPSQPWQGIKFWSQFIESIDKGEKKPAGRRRFFMFKRSQVELEQLWLSSPVEEDLQRGS